jgi:hypothetical protein
MVGPQLPKLMVYLLAQMQTVRIYVLQVFERPLSVKADAQIVLTEKPGGERPLYRRNQPLA